MKNHLKVNLFWSFIAFTTVFFIIYGINTRLNSPILSFNSNVQFSILELDILKVHLSSIEGVEFNKNLFYVLPEFFKPTEEAAWWEAQAQLYDVLAGKKTVAIEFTDKEGIPQKVPATLNYPTLLDILKKVWLIYFVALIYLISAFSLRKYTLPTGKILIFFFLACAFYFISSAPIVSRSIILPILPFKIFTHLLHLSAGGMISLVHFVLVFPEKKLILKVQTWMPPFLYTYFVLTVFLYLFGITAFGTTFPLFFLWIPIIAGASLHSWLKQKDSFFRKQAYLSFMAPVFTGFFFLFCYLLPGTLGIPLVQFTHFALFSLIIPFALPSALSNLALYKEGIEKEKNAQEDKERIKENLHDVILNNLATISATIDVTLGKAQEETLTTKLWSIKNRAVETSKYLRELIQIIEENRTDGQKSWEEFFLLLKEIGYSTIGERNIKFKLDSAEVFKNLPSPPLKIKEPIYWIYKEALVNAVKHADASEINCLISYAAGSIRFEIKDNGKGFDPIIAKQGHFGLDFIKRRVEEKLNGQWTIQSYPTGTSIIFTFPDK